MPHIIHVVENDIPDSFRAQKVSSMFDVSLAKKLNKSWNVYLPIEEKPWSIGLITGASGSGKSIISEQLFKNKIHKGFDWISACLLDDFPKGVELKIITETLSKVGFSSPPSWLLPYKVLSNGQKFRVELARALLEYSELFVFDEFTSVIDRQIAQIGSFAFQKAIRKTNRQFVGVTCHYDVEEWLQPDWVFDVTLNHFKWGSLRRPEIHFNIQRIDYKIWEIFKEHHYLDANINKSAICYCGFIKDRPVAFDAWLPFFGKLKHGKAMRGHRTVVLPDYQGLGLGNSLFTTIASMWKALGYRAFSRTAHPAEISKRLKSPDWKFISQGKSPKDSKISYKHASDRLTAGFEFIGSGMEINEALRLYAK